MEDDHNRRVEELATEFDSPFTEVFADHTDEYPDPEPINGRIPDIVVDDGLGKDVFEVDSSRTHQENEQIEDIQLGLGLFDDLNRIVLDEEKDGWP